MIRSITMGAGMLPIAVLRCVAIGVVLLPAVLPAATVYVSTNSPVSGPGDAWSNAFWTIQGGVDAAQTGDTVLVDSGTYTSGLRAVSSVESSNRVVIDKPIIVTSLNGPATTIIQGRIAPEYGLRCVYMTNGASLSGFTLRGGRAEVDGGFGTFSNRGGGVLAAGVGNVISNCIFQSNYSNRDGGGLWGGAVFDCLFVSNYADYAGGGALSATLVRCRAVANYGYYGGGLSGGSALDSTFTSNTALFGGGVAYAAITNCQLIGNSSSFSAGGSYETSTEGCVLTRNGAPNNGAAVGGTHVHGTFTLNMGNNGIFSSATLLNCLVFDNVATNIGMYDDGTLSDVSLSDGNWEPTWRGGPFYPPGLASDWRLATNAACLGAGSTTSAIPFDIDGEPRRSPPTPGADEPYAATATGSLAVAITPASTQLYAGAELKLTVRVTGSAGSNTWDLGNGAVLTNRLVATYTWPATGSYQVIGRVWNEDNPAGIAATSTVVVTPMPTYYVAPGGGHVSPFDSWVNAATNIQSAIDLAPTNGGLVLVSNGLYNTGAKRTLYPGGAYTSCWNRVALNKPLTVRSVNGPDVTVIEGQGPHGTSAVRCAYLVRGAVLDGFTLRNGYTDTAGHLTAARNGGGALCVRGGMLMNCVIASNQASGGTGGVVDGELVSCVLRKNSSSTVGGASESILTDCVLMENSAGLHGGGAMYGYMIRCAFISNSAVQRGGGVFRPTLAQDCLFLGNTAGGNGGGSAEALAVNCTFVGNSAPAGGPLDASTAMSSIFYNNTALQVAGTTYTNCYFNDPSFANPAAGNFSLMATSPCINIGQYDLISSGSQDLGKLARFYGTNVDAGAYEYRGSEIADIDGDGMPDAWESGEGLSPLLFNSSLANFDGDALTDWEEYVARSQPTNSGSVFDPVTEVRSGAPYPELVVNPSYTDRVYRVELSLDLQQQSWTAIGPAESGTGNYKAFALTNPVPFAAYRIGISMP